MIRFWTCLQQNGFHRVTTKQKKTLKQKDANNKTKTTKATHTHKVCRPPQKCGKRHCGECNVALWIGFGFVPSSCLPNVLSFQVLAFQVLAFQKFFPFRFLPFKFLPFKFLCCIQCCSGWTQEHARTCKNNSTEPKYLSWIPHFRQKSLQSTVMHTVH